MDIQNFAVSESTLEEMVKWIFKYHQLIELLKDYTFKEGFLKIISFTSSDFKFEKVNPLPFVAKFNFYHKYLKYLSL